MGACQLRYVRKPQLERMHGEDLLRAAMLVRKQQLQLIDQAVLRNQRCANPEDRSMCTAGLLLGSLLVALGFEPLELDAGEVEAGVGPAECRRYIGIKA